MPFSKPLPEWGSAGIKPPSDKLANGWKAGEHPPASWFDWFFYTTSQMLTELKTYSLHSELLGAKNGIATLNESGKVPASMLDVQAPSDASTTTKGIVKLNSATNSTDETTAATPKAVKTVMDEVAKKYTKPTSGIPLTDLEKDVSKAKNIDVEDIADYYVSTKLEGILAEVGQAFVGTRTGLASTINASLNA